MMKKVYAVMVAVVLGFASLGQSLALEEADIRVVEPLFHDADLNDAVQLGKWADENGEKLTIYADKDDVAKFDQGMQGLAGIQGPMPAGTAMVVIGEKDPADNTVLVMVFNDAGLFVGGEWISVPIYDAIRDYVEAGI